MVYGSYSLDPLVRVSRDSQVTYDYPRTIPGWFMVATALTPLSKYPEDSISRDSQVTHDYPRNIPGWCMVATALTPLSKYPRIPKLPMIIPGISRDGSCSLDSLVQVSRDSQVTHDHPRNIPGWRMVATALTRNVVIFCGQAN